MGEEEKKAIEDMTREHVKSGKIKKVESSPVATPIFFIKKKDGSLRMVQDYQKLNSYTIKNKYPIPLISDLLNQLKGSKYYTALDVQWGYHNIRIKEGDEWKATFCTHKGLFQPQVDYATPLPPSKQ
jgi:hypothetical protein